MRTDATTLIKLLESLDRELQKCLEHKQKPGVGSEISDPVLLGDFVVETHNRYLESARSLCSDPLLASMTAIEPLGDRAADDYDIERGIGSHPRVVKMVEVSMSVKQLLTILSGDIDLKEDEAQSELRVPVALLDNLGEQIAMTMPVEVMGDDAAEVVARLAQEYNRCLTIILETTDDAALPKMFRPLETGNMEASARVKLTEARLAQSGLLRYLAATLAVPPIRPVPPAPPAKPVPPNLDAEENGRFGEMATPTRSDDDPNAAP